MPTKKTAHKTSPGSRLDAIERLARQHGKDIREVKEAVAVLDREVAGLRHDVEFLKASDALILKELREGFAQLRGEMQHDFTEAQRLEERVADWRQNAHTKSRGAIPSVALAIDSRNTFS